MCTLNPHFNEKKNTGIPTNTSLTHQKGYRLSNEHFTNKEFMNLTNISLLACKSPCPKSGEQMSSPSTVYAGHNKPYDTILIFIYKVKYK